jgi:hypothetical protein
MRLTWIVGALICASAACGGARPGSGRAAPSLTGAEPTSTIDGAPVADVANETASPDAPPSRPTGLERIHTGQERPTIVVDNDFPQPQHLFLDQRWLGSVDPGQSDTFEVPLGVHTFTSADSRDLDDNPSSITEAFESGYRYRYAIRAR